MWLVGTLTQNKQGGWNLPLIWNCFQCGSGIFVIVNYSKFLMSCISKCRTKCFSWKFLGFFLFFTFELYFLISLSTIVHHKTSVPLDLLDVPWSKPVVVRDSRSLSCILSAMFASRWRWTFFWWRHSLFIV